MRLLTVVFAACLIGVRAASAPLTIKLGSLVPEGSPWHSMIQQIGQDWARISGGDVVLKIYPGGVLGDEPDMIKKLRIGQIQAAGVTTVGLSLLDDGLLALHVPLMFESYAELDHVLGRMESRLEERYAAKGYVLISWTDGGWVHFFTKRPVSTVGELRRQKLFVWAGDVKSVEMYTAAGFRPVPLAVTDMIPSLQTGLIDALDAPPLAALINQWFGLAPNMIDLKWAPLIGGVVVNKKVWEKVPPDLRAKMIVAARKAGRQYSGEIRKLGDGAIPAMQKRGLNIVKVDSAAMAELRSEVEKLYPTLRIRMGGPELFDAVLKLRNEYRSRKSR